jgi:hypothetical protein
VQAVHDPGEQHCSGRDVPHLEARPAGRWSRDHGDPACAALVGMPFPFDVSAAERAQCMLDVGDGDVPRRVLRARVRAHGRGTACELRRRALSCPPPHVLVHLRRVGGGQVVRARARREVSRSRRASRALPGPGEGQRVGDTRGLSPCAAEVYRRCCPCWRKHRTQEYLVEESQGSVDTEASALFAIAANRNDRTACSPESSPHEWARERCMILPSCFRHMVEMLYVYVSIIDAYDHQSTRNAHVHVQNNSQKILH